MRLLVDLGGTNARCTLADDLTDNLADNKSNTLFSYKYSNDAYDGFVQVLKQFLADARENLAKDYIPPTQAAMAIAAPISGDHITLTNRGWQFSGEEIKKELQLDKIIMVNDFTANAMALRKLKPEDVKKIGGGTPIEGMPIGVLGPGTGLGVSGLISNGKDWIHISGEGGHITLAASNDEEAEIIARLRRRFGHVSGERVISGIGLTNLYAAVVDDDTLEVSPADITARAENNEEAALKTLELFFNFLGTITADLAVTLGAKGGIYLAGGILPRLESRFCASNFRQRFESKGRFSDYVKQMPTYLITHDVPAFVGLNALLNNE